MIDTTVITYILVGFCIFLTGIIFWNFMPQKTSEKRVSLFDPHVLIEWGKLPQKILKYDDAAGSMYFHLLNGEKPVYPKSDIEIIQDPTRSDRTTYYYVKTTSHIIEPNQLPNIQLMGHAIMSEKKIEEMPKPAVESELSMLKFKLDKQTEETDRIAQRQMQNAILLNRGLTASGNESNKKP